MDRPFEFESFDHEGLQLTSDLRRYGIPTRYSQEFGAPWVGEPPLASVRWEHHVENEKGDGLGEIQGFVVARVVGHPEEAGLFELSSIESLQAVMKAMLGDPSGELNIFALDDRDAQPLATALSGSRPPRVSELLEGSELFVDLHIGVDMEYADVLVIQSPSDISAKLLDLARDYAEEIR